MLDSLITSHTRIKLLKKFFLNSNIKAHLRGLESEFGESSNGIRVELNRFESAGLLVSSKQGNKKVYQANSNHPLFTDIHNIILKETGIDQVIEKVINRIGNLFSVYLTGDFAKGKDRGVIELIFVGESLDLDYLHRKIVQVKGIVQREIKYSVVGPDIIQVYLKVNEFDGILLLWNCQT